MVQPVVFLSYRTTNSRLARLIAAWLTLNNVRVWFAEEQIGLDLQFDRPAIRSSLREAIRSCTHFLILTNADYVVSEWCRFEAELIELRRQRLPLPVIEVCVPADDAVHSAIAFLASNDIGSLTVRDDTVQLFDRLEQEMRRRGWPLPTLICGLKAPSGHTLNTNVATPSEIAIPLSGWRPANERSDLFAEGPDGALRTQHFRRSAPFPAEAHVSFIRFNREEDSDRPKANDACDWDVRDWAIRTLPKVFSDPVTACHMHAVHLDRLWGRVHLGASYSLRQPHPSLGRVAVRKHWSYVYATNVNSDIAVITTFTVYGGRLRLLTMTPLFEHFVRQLELALWPIVSVGSASKVVRPVTFDAELDVDSAIPAPQLGVPADPVVFDTVPPADSLGIGYRLRQMRRWLTGQW